jgi:hypothetical protein
MSNSAPVLLITFNRPDYTSKVLSRLREIQITKLYVFNDGPRESNKVDEAARARIIKLIEDIDWDCEVQTRYSPINLGCGMGVSSAISWAFENEDRLIILEDDCVPSLSFYPYCVEMLERYNHDTRIWVVCGENHDYPEWAFKRSDYIFSQFGFNCGWATWKRCWESFDISMKKLPLFLELDLLPSIFFNQQLIESYKKRYAKLQINLGKPSFWTIQFGFQIMSNRGYFIIPAKNLVTNIGAQGDHTVNGNRFVNVDSCDYFSILRHPEFILADTKVIDYHYNARIRQMFEGRSLKTRILSKLQKAIGRIVNR